MSVIARRFTIRWVNFGVEQGSGYRVSIPNFDGGEVVMAEDYDRLAQQRAGAVSVLEWLVAMDDPDNPAGLEARRTVTLTAIIERARAALGGQ